MNSIFTRTLMCGAIASALGFAGTAIAADTGSAGGDTGNATTQAAPSTSTGTSSTGSTGTSSTGTSSTGSTGSTTGTTGVTGSTGTTGSTTGTTGAGTSTSSTGTTSGSAMPPERPAAAAAADSPAKRIFDQLDANHDGMLSFEEFSRAQFQAPKSRTGATKTRPRWRVFFFPVKPRVRSRSA